MTIKMTLTNPGTLLSCVADAPQAQRQGTAMPVGVFSLRAAQRLNRRWATADETFAHTAARRGGYSKLVVDLPVIKQFRVPLSIRERSS